MADYSMDLLLKDEVYAIIGAAFEVYNTLGPGFLEAVYQEALGIEFTERGIPFESEKIIRIGYKGQLLNKEYQADMVSYGKIILEIKALSQLTADHEAQLLNYLKAADMPVGLLVNFGNVEKLEWKRMVLGDKRRRAGSAPVNPLRELQGSWFTGQANLR